MFKRILTLTLFAMLAIMGLQAQEEASAVSLYNDGLEKAKSGEFESAIELLEQAIEKADPENETEAKVVRLAKANGSRAAYALGTKQLKAKDYDAALAGFQKGVAMNEKYYGNYRGIAQSYEGQDKIAEAIPYYVKAGQLAANDKKAADKADSYLAKAENLVAIAWGNSEWDNVMAFAGALFEAGHETADAYYYLATAHNAKGDSQKAVEMVDKAIAMAEGNPSKYYFKKGEALEAAGQKEAAVEAYKQVTSEKYAEQAKYKVTELSGGK